jgi:hypothetical protein
MYFLNFFLVRFWAFFGKGSKKNPEKYFCKKSMSKKFSEKIDKNFDVSFPRLFCFIAFSGISQRGKFKSTTEKILKKNRVEKPSPKNRQKTQNRFFLGFVLSCFWAFLGEGSSKTRLKIQKNMTGPGTFWRPRNQPTTPRRPAVLFFEGPLADNRLQGADKKKVGDPRGGWVGQSTKKA